MQTKLSKIKKLESRQKLVASIFMGVITILSGLIFWFSFFEEAPLYYTNLPFPVVNNPVKPGSTIIMTVERCNDRNTFTTYTVSRYLQSTDGKNVAVILGSTDVIMEPGCKTSQSQVNILPENTPPGKYRVMGKAVITGTVKPLFVDWYSEEFEVVK